MPLYPYRVTFGYGSGDICRKNSLFLLNNDGSFFLVGFLFCFVLLRGLGFHYQRFYVQSTTHSNLRYEFYTGGHRKDPRTSLFLILVLGRITYGHSFFIYIYFFSVPTLSLQSPLQIIMQSRLARG